MSKVRDKSYCCSNIIICNVKYHLYAYFLLFTFTDGQKRKKSLRKKLDSLGKEKNKDRGKG